MVRAPVERPGCRADADDLDVVARIVDEIQHRPLYLARAALQSCTRTLATGRRISAIDIRQIALEHRRTG